VQLLVKDRVEFAPGYFPEWIKRKSRRRVFLGGPSPGMVASGLACDAIRDAVQPTRKRMLLPDGRGLPQEDEQNSLSRVLRIRVLTKHTPADAVDHRPVPPDQGTQSALVALSEELF
jgi:hypothetical protein